MERLCILINWFNKMANLVSKIASGVTLTGILLDVILHGTDTYSLPPLSNNIGDFKWVAAAGILPALAGDIIPKKYLSPTLEKIMHWTPKAAVVLCTIYVSLGESVLPRILPGTADVWDIPAAVIAGAATYLALDCLFPRKKRDYR